MELERIKKLLMLSTSDNDHEALAALRTAHNFMKKDGLSFMEISFGKKTENKKFDWRNEFDENFEPSKNWRDYQDAAFHQTPREAVEGMFQYVRNNFHSSNFIESLFEWYSEKDFLTPKQWDALKRKAFD